jgi:Xaa-Pro dipeptidase
MDIGTKKCSIYVPDYAPDHALWHGTPHTMQYIQDTFKVDHVFSVSALPEHLEKYDTIHVLDQSECKLPQATAEYLRDAIAECRVLKSDMELDFMREAARISGLAHIELMKNCKTSKSERELDALFQYVCSKNNAPEQAYRPIVAFGRTGATLHYGQNNAEITPSLDQLLLVDAGCEFKCYAS